MPPSRSRGATARGLSISTFHTLGLDILRRHADRAGLRTGFSLFDAQDAEAMLKEHLRKSQRSGRQQRRQRAGAHLALEERPGRPRSRPWAWPRTTTRRDLARLYADYERSLRAYNAVDFDDLILGPARLFRDHPDLLETWQGRIRYLLVDEYQDTNGAQYELVRQLVGPRGALTVVGDDDQSIYAWRGARPENLARLKDDYPHLKVVMLEQNYRSSGRILGLANP